MDSCDEEPRKHPVPVPFCEVIPKPIVPELSLISLDERDVKLDTKPEPFSGTQFQTYNAWRWKYMNGIDKKECNEKSPYDKCNGADKCFLIRDKYSSSETEKRKNEILYGSVEEPRRPLLPKTFPEIPKTRDFFSPSNSFDDVTVLNDSTKTRNNKKCETLSKSTRDDEILDEYLKKEIDSSKNLYSIISEQNKQIEILQQQMEQILKLQEVKDKQINQLLKSQESKERKIEKLLESSDGKDIEIEKLMKSKERQDQRLKDLLLSHEKNERENIELKKQLKTFERKETCSTSTMTERLKVTDSSTNTSAKYPQEVFTIKGDNNNDESVVRNSDEINGFPERDRSLSLHSVDLPVIQDHVPTPQSSIHVDIQDFPYSSEDSDSEPCTVQNKFPPQPHAETNSLGYTFYNNIITQVKDIIQNSGEKEHDAGNVMRENRLWGKRSSVQSFQSWEVLERENIPPNGLIHSGSNNILPKRFPYEQSNLCLRESYSPSDISLKINSLAMKYLKQEQISQYNLQSQMPTQKHPDVTIYNVTNLSFGSTRQDRYKIFPNGGIEQHQQPHKMMNPPLNVGSPGKFSRRKKPLQENPMPY